MDIFPHRPEEVLESSYELSVHALDQLPEPDRPEIAFAGRSNVGKSSLINALIRRKDLARTSNTPGKTRALNVYHLRVRDAEGAEGGLRFVDLPGYGYAQVSKGERERWAPLIEEYLRTRAGLWGVVLVIDGRRPPMESDEQMAEWLGVSAIPYVAVLTKSDKLKQRDLSLVQAASDGVLRSLGARTVLQVSSEKGTGIHRVWPAIAEMGRQAD